MQAMKIFFLLELDEHVFFSEAPLMTFILFHPDVHDPSILKKLKNLEHDEHVFYHSVYFKFILYYIILYFTLFLFYFIILFYSDVREPSLFKR